MATLDYDGFENDVDMRSAMNDDFQLSSSPPSRLSDRSSELENTRLEGEIEDLTEKLKKLLQPLGMSTSRRGMWEGDLTKIKNLRESKPNTMIGVYGATGAGKSTLLKAVLDRNVIPTSGLRACTSAVTSISFHSKPTVKAEVRLTTREGWKEEIIVFLQDIRKDDGTLKRITDIKLSEEDRATWQKIKAVYPSITEDQLLKATPDEIVDLDAGVAHKLGSTIILETEDFEEFLNLVAPFITSDSGALDATNTDQSSESDLQSFQPLQSASLWPVVLEVRIFCSAEALSSGVTLVDLPGVSDANAARGQIAQDYMKACQYFWIVSPITRATDEKIARELVGKAFRQQIKHGTYHAKAITFIARLLKASKCDDIDTNEIIRGLKLWEDPVLQELEKEIRIALDQIADQQVVQNRIQNLISELQQPAMDGPKRKRPVASPGDLVFSKRHCDDSRDIPKGGLITADPSPTSDLEALRSRLRDLELSISQLKSVVDTKSRERKCYCAKKRSEVAIEELQRDFRTGMQEIDATMAEEEEPENFDPDEEKRDYSSINLPVFTCSSRDYLRLREKESSHADGPNCFANYEDTDIPRLQKWCHTVSSSGRKQAALDQAKRAITLANSIQTFLKSQIQVSPVDYSNLRKQWATPKTGIDGKYTKSARSVKREDHHKENKDQLNRAHEDGYPNASSTTQVTSVLELWHLSDLELILVKQEYQELSLVEEGESRGILPRLRLEFCKVSDQWADEIRGKFQAKLFESCTRGGEKCINKAEETHDTFAKSIQWNTYRATIVRRGVYKQDLNADFILPLQRYIARPWNTIFSHTSLFGNIQPKVLDDRVCLLGDDCLKDATLRIEATIKGLNKTMNKARKDITRDLIVQVRSGLTDGYTTAMKEKGRGSVARQKAAFKQFVKDHKHTLFTRTADSIPKGIETAIKTMNRKLEKGLEEIAQRTETILSPAWETSPSSSVQVKRYEHALTEVSEIINQLETVMPCAETA